MSISALPSSSQHLSTTEKLQVRDADSEKKGQDKAAETAKSNQSTGFKTDNAKASGLDIKV